MNAEDKIKFTIGKMMVDEEYRLKYKDVISPSSVSDPKLQLTLTMLKQGEILMTQAYEKHGREFVIFIMKLACWTTKQQMSQEYAKKNKSR